MIEPPPPAAMCGIAHRLMRYAPPTFTANTRFHAARSKSTTVALGSRPAAPLTSTSRRPNARTACSTAFCVSDSDDTSQPIPTQRLPASRAEACAFERSTSRQATEAPAFAKARTMAPPMPPAPATIAALPFSMNLLSPSKVSLLHAFIALECFASPARDDGAGLQDIAAGRGLERIARILLDQEHAGPGLVDGADAAKDFLHHHRRQAERRLVEAQEPGLGHQRARKREH